LQEDMFESQAAQPTKRKDKHLWVWVNKRRFSGEPITAQPGFGSNSRKNHDALRGWMQKWR